MIPKEEWEWFGVAGHFICGQWCRFHLCTKVGEFLVSTVGEYVHPRHSGMSEKAEAEWLKANWPGEDIGYGRKYETMVFVAEHPCLERECDCRMPGITGSELDSCGYNLRGEATRGHLEMCERWAHKTKPVTQE